MNRFLRRSKSKKAFTMVELVVVIAIIGVLAALILPNLMTSDVPVKAKGYAKDYFFVTAFSVFGAYLHCMSKEFLQAFEIVVFPNLVTIFCIFSP